MKATDLCRVWLSLLHGGHLDAKRYTKEQLDEACERAATIKVAPAAL